MNSSQSTAGGCPRGKSRSWPCHAPRPQEETINELWVFVLIRMEASSCYCLLLLYGLVSVEIMDLWLAGAPTKQRSGGTWGHPTPTAPAVTAGTWHLAALGCVPVQAGLGTAPEMLVVCLSSDHRVFFSAL